MNSNPASGIVNDYIRNENVLEELLHIIPYCEEHEQVWSDALVPVILESCSLLDSLWSFQARSSPCIRKTKFEMFDYFKYYGSYMVPKWVIFWGETPYKISPFAGWSVTGNYKEKDDSIILPWWSAYNNLKHDRLSNRIDAKLIHAVYATSALLLAILRCEDAREAIAQTDWAKGRHANPVANLGEDSSSTHLEFASIETKLFSYPVGWCSIHIEKKHYWLGNSSIRFRNWFNDYESPNTT